jgi:ATP/maltotriose-dependent transcriptional regulator MalT
VRLLAAISIETNQPDRARFWIQKGKGEYSEAFLDSWGDYGLVQISIAKGELPKAQSVLSEAQKQYPASDPWLILMQAALEQAEWKREQGGKGTP